MKGAEKKKKESGVQSVQKHWDLSKSVPERVPERKWEGAGERRMRKGELRKLQIEFEGCSELL